MRKAEDTRFVIIGMGFLMEYIYPCYEKELGGNLPDHIIAVTEDAADLARKQERCAFPVQLGGAAKALEKLRPDIILFAPPPSVAPKLIDAVLKPYYEQRRREGVALPILYAFPPNPTGKDYQEKLGGDILVANVLPNMVSSIDGKPLQGEGLTYITFPEAGVWPLEERRFLEDFFAPLGGTIEVPPALVMQMLAGTVLINLISPLVFGVTDALAGSPYQPGYRQIAHAMRGYHRTKRAYHTGSFDAADTGVESYLDHMLRKVVFHWYEGTKRYYLDSGMPEDTADTILTSLLDLHLHVHEKEPREKIEADAKAHATKGGVLEKGQAMYDLLVRAELKRAFCGYPAMRLTDAWCRWLEDTAYQISQVVGQHSRHLASGAGTEAFGIRHHALLFGLMARAIMESKADGGEACLAYAMMRYGRERGGRMRQRCLHYGDTPDMIAYKAYCEWKPEEVAEHRSIDLATSPSHQSRVLQCPWCDFWKEYGLGDYGRHYCDYVDDALVKGFSDELRIELAPVMSRGSEYCEFIWHGADLTEENKAWIAKRRGETRPETTSNWEYHTAHLYHTMTDTLCTCLPTMAADIIRRLRAEYTALINWEALARIDAFRHVDFSVATYAGEVRVEDTL